MLFPLEDILIILEKYKYALIFPIAVIEGPIIIVISGFLVYLGFLNTFLTYAILVLGDLIGDSIYYAVGRYGSNIRWIKKIGHLMGYNKEIKESLNKHFEKHTAKTLLLAKFSHGVGSIVQVTAGMAKVNFSKYLSIQTIGTIPKTLVLFLIGIYIGESYLKINDYMHLIAYIVFGAVSLFLIYIILNKNLKRLF